MTVRAWDAGSEVVGATVSLGSAARELGWQRKELEFAVQLGEVRSVGAGEMAPWNRPVMDGGPPEPVTPGASWRRRVVRAEIDRLTADPCAAAALRARLRLVGTGEAAELMGISPGRFARLARAGCVCPARFYVNRYRAVVWLYLARELTEYVAAEPEVSARRTPDRLRAMMCTGADWRGRNWRVRRVGQLLAHSADPWARAAVSAAVLSTEALVETVPDPAERSYLRELDPPLSPVRAIAPTVREVVDEVLTADGRDEVIWHQIGLAMALEDARSAPRAPARAGAPPRPTDAVAGGVSPTARATPLAVATGAQPADARSNRVRPSSIRERTTPQVLPGSVWEWLTHTATARRAKDAATPAGVTRTRGRPPRDAQRAVNHRRPPSR